MKNIIVISLFLLLIPIATAQSGSMKLLAVSDTKNGEVGGIANLFLEIEPGTGRVFLETFPLTRLDTQISTRFAKQIACDFSNGNCDQYDFFYTITSDSPIIAGPSAGAAITILTFSLINDVKLDKNVAITGTINSGELIGPVGGLKAKIEAASKIGIKKVLIPIGESTNNSIGTDERTNNTFNLEELRKKHKIEIIEVISLDEALFEFTGKRFREKKNNLTINKEYADTMKLLAVDLCSRSEELKKEVPNIELKDKEEEIMEKAINLSKRGKKSFDDRMYYSAASFCFGSNVEFNYLSLLNKNLSEKQVVTKVNALRKELTDFDKTIENEKIKTITDLESYMVFKERLTEANDFLNLVFESITNKNISLRNLAYAGERINSAHSWASFLQNSGKDFDLNKKVIEQACRTKISEVEERFQYVQLYFPESLESTKKELDYAYHDLENGNYELCLFKASKAKAGADTILSVFGVMTENVDRVVNKKLETVERNLIEETEKGIFPILGYSYYEYANTLKSNDPFSALLYSSYALEFSNLDIYFKDSKTTTPNIISKDDNNKTLVFMFILGIIVGIIFSNIFHKKNKTKKKTNKKIKKKIK